MVLSLHSSFSQSLQSPMLHFFIKIEKIGKPVTVQVLGRWGVGKSAPGAAAERWGWANTAELRERVRLRNPSGDSWEHRITACPRHLLSLMLTLTVPLIHCTTLWGSSLILTNLIPSFTLVCYLLCSFVWLPKLSCITHISFRSLTTLLLYLIPCLMFSCSLESGVESV